MDFMFSPILESTQPAFNAGDGLNITYTIPDQVNIKDIKHLGVRIIEQNSNSSVVNTLDSILYIPFNANASQGSTYTVQISNNAIKGGWRAGNYYKIQMRFGTGPLSFTDKNNNNYIYSSDNIEQLSAWKKAYLEEYVFSEWSTVMLTKAITPPNIWLLNQSTQKQSSLIIDNIHGTEYNTMPLFEGVYSSNEEPITHYRFQLYDLTEGNILIEDSDWLVHNTTNDLYYTEKYKSLEEFENLTGGDSHRFKTSMIYDPNNPREYAVIYSVRTLNLYEISAAQYNFSIVETAVESLPNWFTFTFEEDNEEGLVNLSLSSTDETHLSIGSFLLTGTFIIVRSSEKSDFNYWEDIKYLNWSNESFYANGQIIFKDYTIESGIQYKYGILTQNRYKIRTNKKIACYKNTNRDIAQVDFQYAYLYDNGIQLKLKYNNTINSFKRTRLSTKQDTLGSQYPVIMRNGLANYGEFPINALLSLHSDEAQNFFVLKEEGYYYQNELVIPIRKLEQQYKRIATPGNKVLESLNSFLYDTNLTDDNIYIERIFRDKAEAFLNDGRYKLFKSPTEGNMIIGIVNVTMSPNQQLGRMIYSISGTAYEVLENTYENLTKYGIQDLGINNIDDDNDTYIIGQIDDLKIGGKELNGQITSWHDIELRAFIADEIKTMVADSIDQKVYKYELETIESISFEAYPDHNLTEEQRYLESQIADLQSQTTLTKEESLQLEEYKILTKRIQGLIERQRYSPPHRIKVQINNGTKSYELYLGLNQKYVLSDFTEIFGDDKAQSSLEIKILPTVIYTDKENELYYYPPLICNYVAKIRQTENIKYIINEVIAARSWGQIAGLFTADNDFYEMQNSLVNNEFKLPVNIYNTLKISDIIYQYAKAQVSDLFEYNANYFDSYDEDEQAYYNSQEQNIYLRILGFELFDIECDKFNQLNIIGYNNEYNPIIGPTNKYVLKYTELDAIKEITLKNSAYCIVNFQIQCSIEKRGEVIS